MSIHEWNHLPAEEAQSAALSCCGSQRFADALIGARPVTDLDELIAAADRSWVALSKADWLEAFACHPRIGESANRGSRQFAAWSSEEQSKARIAAEPVLGRIAELNLEYEQRHGFLYIVCASGKSAEELLAILESRVANTTEIEIENAAEQQRQITNLRLRKLFNS